MKHSPIHISEFIIDLSTQRLAQDGFVREVNIQFGNLDKLATEIA